MAVCTLGDSTINEQDLDILRDSRSWLNDNVLTFYIEWLLHSQTPSTQESLKDAVILHPSAAFMLRMLPSEELVASTGAGPNPFITAQSDQINFIALPINNEKNALGGGGSHWSLLVIDKANKVGRHFDSSSTNNQQTAMESLMLIEDLLEENHGSFAFVEEKCSQQNNAHDCGVYTLMNLEKFCGIKEELSEQSQYDCVEFRKNLLNMVFTLTKQDA